MHLARFAKSRVANKHIAKDSTHAAQEPGVTTMVPISISENECIELGLDAIGFDGRRQRNATTNNTRFRASYGAGPKSCVEILNDLQTTGHVEARINEPNLIDFLMAMNWLKTYKTESELAGLFKVDEKTSRKWVWKYVKAIRALKHQKVSVGAGLTNRF